MYYLTFSCLCQQKLSAILFIVQNIYPSLFLLRGYFLETIQKYLASCDFFVPSSLLIRCDKLDPGKVLPIFQVLSSDHSKINIWLLLLNMTPTFEEQCSTGFLSEHLLACNITFILFSILYSSIVIWDYMCILVP